MGTDAELIILHEMGHILGLVNILQSPCRIDCSSSNVYTCPKAAAEYSALNLSSSTLLVDAPSCGHWDENAFPYAGSSAADMGFKALVPKTAFRSDLGGDHHD